MGRTKRARTFPRFESLVEATLDKRPVAGHTHNFYKYPARFSPRFAEAFIKAFTSPGDLVLDPFVGGGTSAVEALAAGRNVVAADVNSLAVFVTAAKTQRYTPEEIATVSAWLNEAFEARSTTCQGNIAVPKHLDRKETWRIRRAISAALFRVDVLHSRNAQMLAKCILLRSAQWALDGRNHFPSLPQFWQRFFQYGDEIVQSALEFGSTLDRTPGAQSSCVNCSAEDLPKWFESLNFKRPNLILTSPPYPGIHVLYHRWQVLGGLETAVPYWVSGTQDGHGAAYYTMGGRSAGGIDTYFTRIKSSFERLREISTGETRCVQLLGFSDPETQLPRYLRAMHAAGWREFAPWKLTSKLDKTRIWRTVPNRKWHATMKGTTGASSEVALFLQPRK